jgi:protein CMS1
MSLASKKTGAPHTIVVTSAGLRAADITRYIFRTGLSVSAEALSRVLRTFQTKEAIVAKLFAKHIKLTDAIDYVKKTRCILLPLPL